MTQAYRQKLLRWFMSAGVIALIGTLFLCWILAYDYVGASPIYNPPLLKTQIMASGGVLVTTALGLILALFWHWSDCLDRGQKAPSVATLAFTYPAFLTVLVTFLIATGLHESRLFDLPCAGGSFGFTSCYNQPHWTIVWCTYLSLLALMILSFGKMVFAIRSRFKKAD